MKLRNIGKAFIWTAVGVEIIGALFLESMIDSMAKKYDERNM